MTRVLWTAEDDAVLTYLYPDNRTEDILAFLPGKTKSGLYYRAGKLGLKKAPGLVARLAAEAMADPNHGGRRSQFQKGETSWNKGVSYQAGGRSAETRFKPGHRGGKAVELYRPIGSERISRDGYLERKTNDGELLQRRWRAVHILEWEAINGPLPKGHALAFKDGNKSNITLDNLELITRAELMRRNSYHQYGAEVAKVVQLRGAITRQINKRGSKAA